MTLEAKGRTVTWHNGATGGLSSWMGLDRERARQCVLLSATAGPWTGTASASWRNSHLALSRS